MIACFGRSNAGLARLFEGYLALVVDADVGYRKRVSVGFEGMARGRLVPVDADRYHKFASSIEHPQVLLGFRLDGSPIRVNQISVLYDLDNDGVIGLILVDEFQLTCLIFFGKKTGTTGSNDEEPDEK